MNFAQRIKSSIEPKNDSTFDKINYLCATGFHWSYEETMKAPMKYVIDLVRMWKKVKEEEQKSMKKRR